MAAPVQEERVYTWEEMSRRGGDITSGHAHKVLAELRVAASGERRADGTMVVAGIGAGSAATAGRATAAAAAGGTAGAAAAVTP